MRLCIHRGSRQIGGSCVAVEQDQQRILLDLGLPLDAERNDPSQLPPGMAGLDGRDPSLLGILISHPHLDHFGLLAHVAPNIPVGMGLAARRILTAAAPFLPGHWPIPNPGWDYRSGEPFEVGPFRIMPFLVDHSAYDAYALLIESGNQRLFYSGDFRAHGRKAALFDRLVADPPKDIDVLLVEGTSLGRLEDDQQFSTEADVEEQLMKAFSITDGLALVHTSAQNIDRVVTIFRASKRTGRRLVIDLYTAAVLEATGNPRIPQSDWPDVVLYVPQPQRRQVKDNAWFELLRRHASNRIYIEDLQTAPEKFTLLFRPLHKSDLERGNCLAGASYLYSQWEGYWESGAYDGVKEWLTRHGIPRLSVHTSGHASPADLKTFAAALSARTVVPIHSNMPEHYPDLFSNVEIHQDGEWWEVASNPDGRHVAEPTRGAAAHQPRRRWQSVLAPQELGEFWVVPLTSSKALSSEGWNMRHCVGDYALACANGVYQVFSIRDLGGVRVATLGLTYARGYWSVDQCRGPDNADVIESVREWVDENGKHHGIEEYSDLHYIALEIASLVNAHHQESTS